MTDHRSSAPARRSRGRAAGIALAIVALAAVAGCKDILEVENPNNIAEESLDNPQ
jgi:hypothetical protein